jgi:hypothetical protein
MCGNNSWCSTKPVLQPESHLCDAALHSPHSRSIVVLREVLKEASTGRVRRYEHANELKVLWTYVVWVLAPHAEFIEHYRNAARQQTGRRCGGAAVRGCVERGGNNRFVLPCACARNVLVLSKGLCIPVKDALACRTVTRGMETEDGGAVLGQNIGCTVARTGGPQRDPRAHLTGHAPARLGQLFTHAVAPVRVEVEVGVQVEVGEVREA